ncbi:MAG: helix-turn-helix domain-containing protein [Balneolaceae bacterium]
MTFESPDDDVRHFEFYREKYKTKILIDIGRIESLEHMIRTPEPHTLGFYEIAFITGGSGTFKLDDYSLPIQPRQVFFTSPGQVRRWLSCEPVTGIVLFFEPHFLATFFTDPLFLYRFPFFNYPVNYPALNLDSELFERSLDVLRQIEAEFEKLQNDSPHLIRSLLYQLMIQLNRAYAGQHEAASDDTRLNPIVFSFRKAVDQHFKRLKTVKEYADLLHISPGHLSKICMQHLKKNASLVIKERIMLEAKRLILYSGKTITEIAYELNHADSSNFSRFFSSLQQESPVEFKERLTKQL